MYSNIQRVHDHRALISCQTGTFMYLFIQKVCSNLLVEVCVFLSKKRGNGAREVLFLECRNSSGSDQSADSTSIVDN